MNHSRDEVGVGIVGVGGIAKRHGDAVAAMSGARLVAVCDVDDANRSAFGSNYRIDRRHWYGDINELVYDSDVDCVLVCTPHNLHAPIAEQAAAAGKHVLVEKPISVDLLDADRAIAACNAAGVMFGVIFQRRWAPAAQRVRQAIDEGRIGRILLGDCVVRWHRDAAYYAQKPWRGTWRTEGGGLLVNQMVHAIDLFQWYMGDVEVVHGLYHNLGHRDMPLEVEDNAVAALKFKSGAIGVIEGSISHNPASSARVTVHGDKGPVIGVNEVTEWGDVMNDPWSIPGEEHLPAEWAVTDRNVPMQSLHELQIRDFIDAIRDGRAPAVTAEDGLKSIEIILAIYASAETGQPVSIPMDRQLRPRNHPKAWFPRPEQVPAN